MLNKIWSEEKRQEFFGIWHLIVIRDESGCRIHLYNECNEDNSSCCFKTSFFKSKKPVSSFNCLDIANLEFDYNYQLNLSLQQCVKPGSQNI